MDTAPSIAAPETLDAIRTADLVILVTTPSPLDLATTAATAQRILAERRGETRVLFNLVQTSNRFFNEMSGIAKEIPFPTFKIISHGSPPTRSHKLADGRRGSAKHREEVIKVAMEIAQQLPR